MVICENLATRVVDIFCPDFLSKQLHQNYLLFVESHLLKLCMCTSM